MSKYTFCNDCGVRNDYNHSYDCKHATIEDMREQAKRYHEAWLRENKTVEKHRNKITFWQGKFMMTKNENNKLRKKLYINNTLNKPASE